MSGRFIVVLVAVGLLLGGGIAWFLLKYRPGQYDIAAKPFPEMESAKYGEDDWPWWRGPNRDNHAAGDNYVTEWSESKNVLWRAPIPGFGLSSPILLGPRVFLTTADEGSQRQFVIALDRSTGAKVWETVAHQGSFPTRKHGDNSFATSTPATDGKQVFAAFQNAGSIHITALDLNGRILWQREVGPSGGSGHFGYGSSLALWGPYVYASDDSPDGGWIAAINRETGEIGWRTGRRTGAGSYGTPTIAEFAGKTMVVLAGNGNVTAYDARDGKSLWVASGLGETTANTVTVGDGMLFASNGAGRPQRTLLAVRPGGSVAWKKENRSEVPYPPSMLYHDRHLYVANDQNSLGWCLQAETGEEEWSERMPGTGCYASPLLAGKYIYICDRDGNTKVIEASPDGLVVVARNKLEGPIDASPVAAGGRLFIRNRTHLYSLGQEETRKP